MLTVSKIVEKCDEICTGGIYCWGNKDAYLNCDICPIQELVDYIQELDEEDERLPLFTF